MKPKPNKIRTLAKIRCLAVRLFNAGQRCKLERDQKMDDRYRTWKDLSKEDVSVWYAIAEFACKEIKPIRR